MRMCEFLFVEEITGNISCLLENKLFIRRSGAGSKILGFFGKPAEKYPMEEFSEVDSDFGAKFNISPHDDFPYAEFLNIIQNKAQIPIGSVNVSWLNIIKKNSGAIFGTKLTIHFSSGKHKIFTDSRTPQNMLIICSPNPFISKKARKNLRVNYMK